MSDVKYSREQLVDQANMTPEDLAVSKQRRRPDTQLGFAYQLAFVRLFNCFPIQQPIEIDEEILTFVSLQLGLPSDLMSSYGYRQPTISDHREQILAYLKLRRLGEAELILLRGFLFEEACRLEQTSALLSRATSFLKEHRILQPADDTLLRLIRQTRDQARQHIYQKISDPLPVESKGRLDRLVEVDEGRLSPLQTLKDAPRRASPQSMLRLLEKLERIEATGILTIDISWLNNNYPRSLTRYVKRCSANRIRDLVPTRRYAVLVCFLWQTYRDTLDYAVDMHDKIMTGVYNQAEKEINEYTRAQRQTLRRSLYTLKTVSQVILDDSIDDQDLRHHLFDKVSREELAAQMQAIEEWLTGKHSHVFHLVVKRFAYLRQFASTFLKHLQFQSENDENISLLEAIQLLQQLNRENKRKLPDDAPIDFLPNTIQDIVIVDGKISKAAWECALLNTVRDEIKSGNIHVHRSKRFGRFGDFLSLDLSGTPCVKISPSGQDSPPRRMRARHT